MVCLKVELTIIIMATLVLLLMVMIIRNLNTKTNSNNNTQQSVADMISNSKGSILLLNTNLNQTTVSSFIT
jgi:hypothetical protein